jgi:hypothetical protein
VSGLPARADLLKSHLPPAWRPAFERLLLDVFAAGKAEGQGAPRPQSLTPHRPCAYCYASAGFHGEIPLDCSPSCYRGDYTDGVAIG